MKQLIGIVAMTPQRIIGRDGTLPWHIPEDLAFFKKTTTGHPIIMGRKTFDSIGKPLPKRRNIIITRDTQWSHPGVEVIHHPQQLEPLLENTDTPAYIIGGAEIYTLFLPLMHALLITHVHEDYLGDTFFPSYQEHFPHVTELQKSPQFTISLHSRKITNS